MTMASPELFCWEEGQRAGHGGQTLGRHQGHLSLWEDNWGAAGRGRGQESGGGGCFLLSPLQLRMGIKEVSDWAVGSDDVAGKLAALIGRLYTGTLNLPTHFHCYFFVLYTWDIYYYNYYYQVHSIAYNIVRDRKRPIVDIDG